ncbi:hypothetical protein BU23DRAFT_252315 [Bimuria novae-zelandiae CBS 107.79]|uniref:Uncharacterized protein n=1 Tax=Bimuria novae-zelandiae CBS 107.79 TaxID=1447943 RepID=A0A6A5VN60_9PLEO|nr:hypothetical protein BU23DRAFT_252315 [Bimuria novae-zelandiae CBS 107.79]
MAYNSHSGNDNGFSASNGAPTTADNQSVNESLSSASSFPHTPANTEASDDDADSVSTVRHTGQVKNTTATSNASFPGGTSSQANNTATAAGNDVANYGIASSAKSTSGRIKNTTTKAAENAVTLGAAMSSGNSDIGRIENTATDDMAYFVRSILPPIENNDTAAKAPRPSSAARNMANAPIPSVRSVPGGEIRNRHANSKTISSSSRLLRKYPTATASASATNVLSPVSHSAEYQRELPMQYNFPVRTPLAGKYVPPPPWYHKFGKWRWWGDNIKYWVTCQGCFEDQGCFAKDGCWDSCDWRCCLSCWCPWCKSPPFFSSFRFCLRPNRGGIRSGKTVPFKNVLILRVTSG